jgi:hypothetical protein
MLRTYFLFSADLRLKFTLGEGHQVLRDLRGDRHAKLGVVTQSKNVSVVDPTIHWIEVGAFAPTFKAVTPTINVIPYVHQSSLIHLHISSHDWEAFQHQQENPHGSSIEVMKYFINV